MYVTIITLERRRNIIKQKLYSNLNRVLSCFRRLSRLEAE